MDSLHIIIKSYCSMQKIPNPILSFNRTGHGNNKPSLRRSMTRNQKTLLLPVCKMTDFHAIQDFDSLQVLRTLHHTRQL